MNETNLPVPVAHPAPPAPPPPPAADPHGGGGGHTAGGVPPDLPRPGGGTIVAVLTAFVILLGLLFVVGFVPAHREQTKTRDAAAERANAKAAVQWLHPVPTSGEKDVHLPADVRAFQETALFPRANGYLKHWSFDIGAHVEQGQVMAVIDTPEIDAELQQKEAALAQANAAIRTAESQLNLAGKQLKRYKDSQATSPGSVSQNDVDVAQATYDNNKASLDQSKANAKSAEEDRNQVKTLVGFEKIYAPFSGTVTARNYDNGRLLNPTDTTAGHEMFDLAETDKMRVFVNVPQGYANNVKLGQTARLKLRNFPGREFEGKVTYTAGALDLNTRTLRVQIDFDNKGGELFANAYGEVELPVTPQLPVMVIRSSSLDFVATGTEVAVVDPQGKVHIKPIVVGRDLGTELQVTSGLTADDRVIINPGERTVEGATVDAVEAAHEKPTSQPAAPPPPPTTTRPSQAGV